ncbi:MAG: hypothetical protein LBK99_12110 [Opitutaceae bacterium]|nr:hypothetical protein [Opitutaceae bacterium]
MPASRSWSTARKASVSGNGYTATGPTSSYPTPATSGAPGRPGVRVPEDAGFASLNVGEADDTTSGIHQNDHLIGRKAIDLLVDMVHRNERGIPATPIRTLVEGVWHPGKTPRKPGC